MATTAPYAEIKSALTSGGTMEREYISSTFTGPMKAISTLMFITVTLGFLPKFVEGNFENSPVVLLVSAYFFYFWMQDIVYIEENELVVKRFSRSIRLRPGDIRDVDYFGLTGLLKLSFQQPTRFGDSILFLARSKRMFGERNPIDDDGPVFERIGIFCGWKSK